MGHLIAVVIVVRDSLGCSGWYNYDGHARMVHNVVGDTSQESTSQNSESSVTHDNHVCLLALRDVTDLLSHRNIFGILGNETSFEFVLSQLVLVVIAQFFHLLSAAKTKKITLKSEPLQKT